MKVVEGMQARKKGVVIELIPISSIPYDRLITLTSEDCTLNLYSVEVRYPSELLRYKSFMAQRVMINDYETLILRLKNRNIEIATLFLDSIILYCLLTDRI